MKLPRRARVGLELPLSPLIDIIFILLIFVVLVARFTDDGQLPVRPPEATRSEALPDEGALVVVLQADGSLSIQGRPVARDALPAVLGAARRTHDAVVLMGDRDVALQGAVEVLDAAGAAGFEAVGVVTRPPAPGSAPPG